MSDEKQLGLRLGDKKKDDDRWKKGKTDFSIAFVLECEAMLQSKHITGPDRQRLINVTTHVKQGRWVVMRAIEPEDVMFNLTKLQRSGTIITNKK